MLKYIKYLEQFHLLTCTALFWPRLRTSWKRQSGPDFKHWASGYEFVAVLERGPRVVLMEAKGGTSTGRQEKLPEEWMSQRRLEGWGGAEKNLS